MDIDEMIIASECKQLRACYGCHLVKSVRQFKESHCENCEWTKDYELEHYTSANFESIVVLADANFSWVGR